MITKTVIKDNLLGLGLLSHIGALVIAAVPRLDGVGAILYLIATFLLLSWVFLTWDREGEKSRFYIACIVAFFPLIGPLLTMKMVHPLSEKRGNKSWIMSVFTLQIHPTVVLVWIIAIAVATALTFQQYDPYFSNRHPISPTTPR